MESRVDEQVWWVIEVTVRPGSFDDFEALTHHMVEAATSEPGALTYERYISADRTRVHLHERYEDSSAALRHLLHFRTSFAERFLALVDRGFVHLYGKATPELRTVMEGLGGDHLQLLDGFSRTSADIPVATAPSTNDRCEICGFVYDTTSASGAGPAIAREAEQLAAILEGQTTNVAQRPNATTWSVLEYCCHVRDVLLVQRERVLRARREHRPVNDVMGRDERVEHDGYSEQQPSAVARQLRDAATLFVGVLAHFDDETWTRTLVYNYPFPAERDLAWVAVHTQHEVRHHLADVRNQVGAAAG